MLHCVSHFKWYSECLILNVMLSVFTLSVGFLNKSVCTISAAFWNVVLYWKFKYYASRLCHRKINFQGISFFSPKRFFCVCMFVIISQLIQHFSSTRFINLTWCLKKITNICLPPCLFCFKVAQTKSNFVLLQEQSFSFSLRTLTSNVLLLNHITKLEQTPP